MPPGREPLPPKGLRSRGYLARGAATLSVHAERNYALELGEALAFVPATEARSATTSSLFIGLP